MTRAGRRVVVACFASHIHRVQQVVDAAVASGRKVATLGRSMGKNVELARRLGILTVPEGTLVDIDEIDLLTDGEICVISTGSQGEPMSALSLMATGDNKRLRIEEGDVVVISAHPIPGNEWSVGRVIDELHRRGAEVVHSGTEAVHVSGHARQGELATLISVARPQAFVPVHGEYRHMVHHAALARATGVPADQVLLCEDGDAVSLDAEGLRRDGTVPAGYLYVDGTVGDVGHGVLRDRKVLAEEGVVMVVATVDLHRRVLSGEPQIATKGWVHAPEAEELLGEASQVVALALGAGHGRRRPRRRGAGPPRPQGPGPVRGRPHPSPAVHHPGRHGGVAVPAGSPGGGTPACLGRRRGSGTGAAAALEHAEPHPATLRDAGWADRPECGHSVRARG